MKVLFNNMKEFCQELEKDADRIDRKIVRITSCLSRASISPNIQHLSVIATYSVDGQLVELDSLCGDTFRGVEEESNTTIDVAIKRQDEIKEVCKRLGLEVRTGCLRESIQN